MVPTKRYVRESGEGWQVMRAGDRRSGIVAGSKEQAVRRAREIVRRAGGGEVTVLNSVGKVTSTAKVSRPRAKS